MIRFYPSVEGYHAPSGSAYPDVTPGLIRVELEDFIKELQKICDSKKYKLFITSLNHGDHVGNSMHYKGLAIDFNLKDNQNKWIDFKIQSNLSADALNELNYDGWIWASDPDPDDDSAHTHVSVHPIIVNGETIVYIV